MSSRGGRDPMVIELPPSDRRGRLARWLRRRRLPLGLALAAVEVVAFLVRRPGALGAALLAVLVLALALAAALRMPPGPGRDLLWIVAIAQGVVVAVPLLVGLSVIVGLMVALLVIVALVAMATRGRP